MKVVLNGILLKKIDYSESSLILHFFTLEKGFLSFIFQGGKKKKGNTLFPLSIVEITSYLRKESELGRISEISTNFVPQTLHYDFIKSSLLFFMAEILDHVLKNNEEEQELYHFIEQEIRWLDSADNVANYPIWFVLQIIKKWGVGINTDTDNGRFFNLKEGEILVQSRLDEFIVEDDSIPYLAYMINKNKEKSLDYFIPKKGRKLILQHLMDYLKFHLHGFRGAKSVEVLETVLE